MGLFLNLQMYIKIQTSWHWTGRKADAFQFRYEIQIPFYWLGINWNCVHFCWQILISPSRAYVCRAYCWEYEVPCAASWISHCGDSFPPPWLCRSDIPIGLASIIQTSNFARHFVFCLARLLHITPTPPILFNHIQNGWLS